MTDGSLQAAGRQADYCKLVPNPRILRNHFCSAGPCSLIEFVRTLSDKDLSIIAFFQNKQDLWSKTCDERCQADALDACASTIFSLKMSIKIWSANF